MSSNASRMQWTEKLWMVEESCLTQKGISI